MIIARKVSIHALNMINLASSCFCRQGSEFLFVVHIIHYKNRVVQVSRTGTGPGTGTFQTTVVALGQFCFVSSTFCRGHLSQVEFSSKKGHNEAFNWH